MNKLKRVPVGNIVAAVLSWIFFPWQIALIISIFVLEFEWDIR